MPDTFAITIIFIVLSTMVAAFFRGRSRDKCLKDFSDNVVTVEKTSSKTILGRLKVENNGLELTYLTAKKNTSGDKETSYILYKYEYPEILLLIRYHDALSQANKEAREKELKRTYHPNFVRRLNRNIQNLFKTVRDSLMEIINMFLGLAKKGMPGGAVLTSQDKYVSKIKKEIMESAGTSYEPLLERYIGHRVILQVLKGDAIIEYSGVLKDYTADFIEVMDVNYATTDDQLLKKADLVIPRKHGMIRHLAE